MRARWRASGAVSFRVLPVVDHRHPFKYDDLQVPITYRCSGCRAIGCKLWRDYQTFLNCQSLLCAVCAAKEQGKENIETIDEKGKRQTEFGPTDQIGWRVPAVPTEENDTFWGYTSVPQSGCNWRARLPSLPEKHKAL